MDCFVLHFNLSVSDVCQRQADIVFVLDMSSSIGQSNWDLMLAFVVNIIQKLTISEAGVHIGVVTFSDTSYTEFHLDSHFNKASLINAINSIFYKGGNTRTSSGIKRMMDDVFDPLGRDLKGDRSDVANLAIVITDGESNLDPHKTVPYANEAKDKNIKVFAVGITKAVNETELKGISSNGIRGETYWLSDDFNVTDEIVKGIVRKTCDNIGQGKIYQIPTSSCNSFNTNVCYFFVISLKHMI